MAAEDFHFAKIPDLVKLIILKKLDLESLISLGLTSRNTQLVRKLTPSLVEIRMEQESVQIKVTFPLGTFPEGRNDFEWRFFETSRKISEFVEKLKNFDEPSYISENYVLDDGFVLKDLFQIDNHVGCRVPFGSMADVYTRVERLLLNEIFLPAKKVVVTVTEPFVALLGRAFSSRKKLSVTSLTLDGKWTKTRHLATILNGFEVDKLVLGKKFHVDYRTVNWRKLSIHSRAVLFSNGDLFKYFGFTSPLPFRFEKAKLEDCSVSHFFMFVEAWLEKSMDGLSLVTAVISLSEAEFKQNLFRCNNKKSQLYAELVREGYIYQTDVNNQLVRLFHIPRGYAFKKNSFVSRAFCWHTEGKAYFLVMSRNYEEILESTGKRIAAERKLEKERIMANWEQSRNREKSYEYRDALEKVKKTIEEDEVKIKEQREKVEDLESFLKLAPKIEKEEEEDDHDKDKDKKTPDVFEDIDTIRKCLEHDPDSAELAKQLPASQYKFTLFTKYPFEDDGHLRQFEIQIKNTANNKEMAIKFQYIAQHDMFEVFLNETQLGKSALTGIRLRRAPNNQYSDRLREKACRKIWFRLQTLFPTAEFSLTLRTHDRDRMPILFRAQKKHTLKCTHVKLVGDWRTDEFEKTIKCLEIAKTMEFSHNFKVRKMPSEMPFVDEIVIDRDFSYGTRFPGWTFKCRKIRVEATSVFMNSCLREMISDWKAGKLCSTFESMHVQSWNLKNEDTQQKFLEEFDGKPWDPSQRSGFFCKLSESQNTICHDLRKGLDFQRSSDGSTATLLISTDYHYNLKFIAWKKGEELYTPSTNNVKNWKELEVERLERLQKKVVDMKKEARRLRWKIHEDDRMNREISGIPSGAIEPDDLDD